MKRLLLAAFIVAFSICGQAQTHKTAMLDLNNAWTGTHTFTGNGAGGVGTADGGAVNIQKSSSPSAIFMGRAVDVWGNTNAQLIGFNVEQMVNPTASVNYFNAAITDELFIPIGNTQNFTGSQAGADFSFINYGSGTFSANQGVGVIGESWNSGPATSILELDGVAGGCHNGSVSAGIPVQVPTGNGSVTNCRALTASVTNSSTGVITNAVGVYINGTSNTGGGSVTNNHGLHVADQTVGGSNWAIQTGLGLVQFGDNLRLDKLLSIGAAASASAAAFIQPSSLTGTSQYGLRSLPTTNSAATAFGIGGYFRADTAAAAFTQTSNAGVYVANGSKGSGSTVSQAYGVVVEDITIGTVNRAIKTLGAALSEFDGGTQGASVAGLGTATFAAGASAGTSPGTPTCTTSHICDSFSGTVSFTMGTATTTGIALTVTTSTTRTNQANCVGAMYLVASPFTAIPIRLTETTTTVIFNTGTAPTASTAYELTYVCGGN